MPHLIVLRGPIGAGKTTTARALSKLLPNCSFVEIDAIKRMADPNRSSAWRRAVALDTSVYLCRQLLEQGRSVVTETLARWPEQTERFRLVARQLPDVTFAGVLMSAPLETCVKRAMTRRIPNISYAVDETMVKQYYTNLRPASHELVVDTLQLGPTQAAVLIARFVQPENMETT